jgi:DNA-binding SARP family transcriptional activator
MSELRVLLFHRFEVWRAHQPVVAEVRKVQELLSYLILYRPVPHLRDILADHLWNDTTATQARRNLRRTLWQLQAMLDNGKAAAKYLLVEDEWVQLHPHATLWVDAIVFEESYEKVRAKPGHALGAEEVDLARAAVNLYRGDLLEGWYHDWCLHERQRFQFMYLAMLDKLTTHCEAHRNYEEGIDYATRMLRHDPARERAHRQLMCLYYLAGDRSAALQQYERCVAFLRAELDVPPDDHTTALYVDIRTNRLLPLPSATSDADSVFKAQLSLLLEQLERLHAELASMQVQVEEQIQQLRKADELSLVRQS